MALDLKRASQAVRSALPGSLLHVEKLRPHHRHLDQKFCRWGLGSCVFNELSDDRCRVKVKTFDPQAANLGVMNSN